MSQPLFVTGSARSGSTLLAQILSANDYASVVSDPFFPLFRSLRDALLRTAGIDALPAGAPMQDYYFTDARIAMLDAVQSGNLSVPFLGDSEALGAATAARAQTESPDLVPRLETLGGRTYEELFRNALRLLEEARPSRRWVGCKEVWTIELFAPLARAFPEARFVVIVRDPRAVLASLQLLAAADASQAAHPLSYCRHWRKEIAFLERYAQLPELAGRVHVLRYEELVTAPEETARSLCEFLEIPFAQTMLAPAWRGNSSFQRTTEGIDASLAERWRGVLEPAQLNLAELACGPEMELVDYRLATAGAADDAVLEHLIESDRWSVSWRSDLGDSELDYALELGRQNLLDRDADTAEVRRAFLFPEAYTALRRRLPVEAR
jgi:hypothetical protein